MPEMALSDTVAGISEWSYKVKVKVIYVALLQLFMVIIYSTADKGLK